MPESTPNLSEALEQASSSLQDSESQTQPETLEQQPAAETPKETVQEDQLEEDFLEIPKSVSEEEKPTLEEIKKNWQSAYTKKRQAEKAELLAMQKELETLRAQRGNPQEPMQNQQMTAEQIIEEEVARVQANAYIKAQQKAYFELDPRLKEDNPEFDRRLHVNVQDVLMEAREKYEAENGTVNGFDFIGEAKKAIQDWDNYLEARNKAYIEKQNQAIKAQTDKAKKVNAGSSSVSVEKPITSLEDALDAAFSQQKG